MASARARWHPEAVNDALSARDWYAERSLLAARGFLLALDDALTAVVENPQVSCEGLSGCRHYVFPCRYPFTLDYRLAGDIEIVAVAHQRRRPGYWGHR